MSIALWIIQALLALLFLASGARKLTQPQVALVKATPLLGDFPLPFVRIIGAAELLGGIGLILPAATRITPVLTLAAATGITLLMVCATVVHAARGEYAKIGLTCGLPLLAVFVMYGRLVLVPIAGASPDDHAGCSSGQPRRAMRRAMRRRDRDHGALRGQAPRVASAQQAAAGTGAGTGRRWLIAVP